MTLKELSKYISYNPTTGKFRWIKKNSIRCSDDVGFDKVYKGQFRYRATMINGQIYPLHRLAWLFANGEWPEYGINHKDGDKRNNRIDNLVLAKPRGFKMVSVFRCGRVSEESVAGRHRAIRLARSVKDDGLCRVMLIDPNGDVEGVWEKK